MAFGCLCVALGNLIMVAAAWNAGDGKAGALWLVAYFAVVTIGELHLAPVGLALVSKVAPAKVLSMMMGVWFATTFPGDILAGWLGGFWSSMGKPQFFLMIASIAARRRRRHPRNSSRCCGRCSTIQGMRRRAGNGVYSIVGMKRSSSAPSPARSPDGGQPRARAPQTSTGRNRRGCPPYALERDDFRLIP